MRNNIPMSQALYTDCETDVERAEFFESGRAHETGVVASSIAADIARAFYAKDCIAISADYWRRLPKLSGSGRQMAPALRAVADEKESNVSVLHGLRGALEKSLRILDNVYADILLDDGIPTIGLINARKLARSALLAAHKGPKT